MKCKYFGHYCGKLGSAVIFADPGSGKWGAMPESVLIKARIFAREISSGLHRTVWRAWNSGDQSMRGLVYVSDGKAEIVSGDETFRFEAPSVFWLSKASGRRMVLEAGTTGYVAEISDDMVTRAVGDFSESARLRFLVESNHCLFLERRHGVAVASSLASLLEELQAPQSGSEMLMVAHLRIILVTIMRLSGVEEPQRDNSGSSAHFLQKFRRLVEINFRAHWPISRYAELIGISHDRLHAICRRELHRTPKALVAERLAREAGLGLERSTLTIEQLSHSLGFRDPAHFSHFFKRMTGVTPGAFRRMMARAASDGAAASPANFGDWP